MARLEEDFAEQIRGSLPDPWLLLGGAKLHLADHSPLTVGDAEAWAICDRLQEEADCA
jgi:hypothetical protein